MKNEYMYILTKTSRILLVYHRKRRQINPKALSEFPDSPHTAFTLTELEEITNRKIQLF